MKYVTLSSKNQITLPASLLRDLAISPRSKLLVTTDNDTIVVKPVKQSVVEKTAGSLAKYIPVSKRNVSFSKVREETMKEVVADLAKKYNL